MIKRKKAFLLGEATVKIIIAVLCIVVLIFLIVKLYELYGSSNKENLANAELENILAYGNRAIQEKKEMKYLATTVADWWLISSEFGDFCSGKFCLCLCEDVDCSGFKACKATDRFFLLREKENIEVRTYKLESPVELKINYSEEKVYPFNAGKAVDITDFSWVRNLAFALGVGPGILVQFTPKDLYKIIDMTTPIFFKFDNEWKWSPDLESWMNLNTLKPTGKWAVRGELSAANKNFIRAFRDLEKPNALSEKIGDNFFKNSKTYKSEGVIIITKE